MSDTERARRPEERVVQVAAPKAELTSAAIILGRPAVAVLPFANLSGDPEQEYFADGLTEDILTALCAWRQFPVIARNSSFAYKGTSPDVRKVGQELGARYVLEGSVRKGGNRVRVTGQLIDADTGHHVWAERDDRDLADVFELQDELTRRIVATLIPEVERAERERASTKPPENLDAWDCYLRGMAFYNDLSSDAMIRARALFERAAELDPGWAKPQARIAMTYHRQLRFDPAVDRDAARARMLAASEMAVRLDDGDCMSHWVRASVLTLTGQHEACDKEVRRALELNPADADASYTCGANFLSQGRAREAIANMEATIRLSPRDPRMPMMQRGLTQASFEAGDYERAVATARDALGRDDASRIAATLRSGITLLWIASLGHLGRGDDAAALIRSVDPALLGVRGSDIFTNQVFRRRTALWDSVLAGLRKAGVPDVPDALPEVP